MSTLVDGTRGGWLALNNGETETVPESLSGTVHCGAPPPKWPSIPEDAALSKYFTVGRHGKVRDFLSAHSGEEQSRDLETKPVKRRAASCAFCVFISTQSVLSEVSVPLAASQSLYVTARAHTWIVNKERITNECAWVGVPGTRAR